MKILTLQRTEWTEKEQMTTKTPMVEHRQNGMDYSE